MKKIFLAASFADVSSHLAVFLNESLQDRSVAFIATASLVEDYRGYVENDRLAFKNLGLRSGFSFDSSVLNNTTFTPSNKAVNPCVSN